MFPRRLALITSAAVFEVVASLAFSSRGPPATASVKEPSCSFLRAAAHISVSGQKLSTLREIRPSGSSKSKTCEAKGSHNGVIVFATLFEQTDRARPSTVGEESIVQLQSGPLNVFSVSYGRSNGSSGVEVWASNRHEVLEVGEVGREPGASASWITKRKGVEIARLVLGGSG